MFGSLFRVSATFVVLLALHGTAFADIIYFSADSSSDWENGEDPPPSALGANIAYSFESIGLNSGELTIDFENMSSGLLTQLYFSTGSDVTGFVINSTWLNDGFSSTLTGATVGAHDGTPVDGMGYYDWVMDFGSGGTGIDDYGAGIDGTITMTVSGSNLDLTDFFLAGDPDFKTNYTNAGPAVLKFQSLDVFTQQYNSAFGLGSDVPIIEDPPVGDPVPEPGTIGLLFMGIVGLASTRVRRRTT